MDKQLKRGMNENPKTRSIAKKVTAFALLGSMLFLSLACAMSSGYAASQTATAVYWDPTEAVESTPTQAPTQPVSQVVPTLTKAVPTAAPTTVPPTSTPAAADVSVTNTPSTLVTATPSREDDTPILYYSQAGDTLPAISARFDVIPDVISSPDDISLISLIDPNQLLIIPRRFDDDEITSKEILMPDSEIVFSPSAIDFDVDAYVREAGGYLNEYREWRVGGWYTGIEIIETVAIENSINPRLLLAMLEYESNWVTGQPANLAQTDYPMGWNDFHLKGLYRQLSWAVQQLSIGYYGWRAGLVTELVFTNNESIRIAPELNAGTVAIQYMMAQLYNDREWTGALYDPDSLPALYEKMFGNPWTRALSVEPLLPTHLQQPEMELPFQENIRWSMTGGPHSAWGPDGALAALDFAPASQDHGCVESTRWVTASTPGLVVRSEQGAVIVDLDGDGHEQTGWALLYMHIATKDRVEVGTWLSTDDRIGHPSCEGGVSNGTHVHFARKYNGEWVLADGPLPFVLSGWQAHAGDIPYEGFLTKDDQVISASQVGSFESCIVRCDDFLNSICK